MNTILETARFSRPYLARYWPRFTLGIFLGILFGASNGLSLGSIYVILNRLDDPAHIQEVTEKGREAQVKKEEGENIVIHGLKAEATTLKQEFYVLIDPWLPLKDRPLDWKQCLGGFLFIPLAILLRGALGYGSSYLMAWSGQRITNAVKNDAFRKVSSLSLDFFQKTTTGELIARIESDGAALNNFLKLGLSDLVKEPSTIFFMLGFMFWIDWKFTLISLAFAPLCVVPTRQVAKKIKELARRDFAANVGQASITLESFQNVRITKAYGLEEAHAQAFFKSGERSAYFTVKSIQSKEMLNPIVQTLNAMGISALLLYAFWTHCPFANLSTFLIALMAFYTPFKKLNGIGVYITQLSVALERLMALFKLQPTVREIPNPVPMTGFARAIEFRNVAFSYGDGPVLDNITFTLARGQRLGLAGESGSGKSSLINLLFRFYDPTAGQIKIDGVPLETLRIADLRRHLALVSQDILLFNATVAENIGFGKIGATRQEIIAAAREAHAHAFIEALPRGYDTPLGERGQRLSGGQRQRIAIARAFVRNAPILVLDEATASLDSQSEAEVQKAIDHLAENRTVICVAHRLSTLRSMDRIIVLDKGRIVEQGGFDQLLAQHGLFTAMAARQSIHPQPQPA
ncbi:MAG TPA: ABC transporter ATP-binding protein [Candidatus Methylacidiphilales bacterium]|jgi:subfamily B ATP-binding cassette protein MsbA|nr:ABC transporter ATP-binding protein [Candidatus Methylacidiphilales bacterium]